MKSKLTVDFGTKVLEFDVDWIGKTISSETNITEDIFYSDKYEDLWDSGDEPTMIVEAHDGQSSAVVFEDMAGELFSIKPYKAL